MNLRKRFFNGIFILSTTYPKTVVVGVTLLAVLSIVYSALNLRLESDQDKLIDERVPHHHNYLEFVRQTGDQEYIYAVVENATEDEYAMFAGEFEKAVLRHPDLFPKYYYKIDLSGLVEKGLYFETPEQLRQIRSGLSDVVAMIREEEIAKRRAESGERIQAEREKKTKGEEECGVSYEEGKRLYFQGYSVAEIRKLDEERCREKAAKERGPTDKAVEQKQVKVPKKAASVEDSFFTEAFLEAYARRFGKGEAKQPKVDENVSGLGAGFSLLDITKTVYYLKEGDEKKPFYLFLILPKKNYTQMNIVEEPLRVLHQIRGDLKKQFPTIQMGFTGRPVLQADEMETTNRDTTWATIVSAIGVLLLIVWGFRDIRHPLLGIYALGLGICFTYGAAALLIGYLNILSVVFCLILIGCGIEYAIQLISRYREERCGGQAVKPALGVALQTAARGTLTGMVTSAVAFVTPVFSDFKGLAELGWISALGLLFCYLSITLVVPALIVLVDGGKLERPIKKGGLREGYFGWLGFVFRYPRTVFSLCCMSALSAVLFVPRLHLSYNILELQSQGLESVRLEEKIVNESRRSTWYSGRIFDSIAEERDFVRTARTDLRSVALVESVSDMIPELSPAKKRELVELRRVFRELDPVTFVTWIDRQIDLETFASEVSRLEKDPKKLSESVFHNIESFEDASRRDESAVRLAFPEIKREVLEALKVWLGRSKEGLRSIRFDQASVLPPFLRDRFILPTGKTVAYLYPKENVWKDEAMRAHISELSAFDSKITGPAFSVYHSSVMMTETFRRSALLSLVLVLLCVLLDFKRLPETVSSFVPLVFGFGWLVLVMVGLGLNFNLANFFSIPILIGVGIDNGVVMANRFRESRSALVVLRSTGLAVTMTVLTTCVSFGSMGLARHQGIASLGIIVTIGMLACLAGSLVGLSAFFKIRERGR